MEKTSKTTLGTSYDKSSCLKGPSSAQNPPTPVAKKKYDAKGKPVTGHDILASPRKKY